MQKSQTNPPMTFILDGFLGNHSRWARLQRLIDSTIGPCCIWHYDTSGRTSLENVGAALRAEMEKCDAPVNLVGYSMGGIVAREAARTTGRDINRAVFLHSPHNGSLLSYIFPRLAACREMRPGSDFLARLDAAEWNTPTLATWCAWDAVVVPGISARWLRASTTLQSHVPAHAWPVFSPAIHAAVVGFLGGNERGSVKLGRSNSGA